MLAQWVLYGAIPQFLLKKTCIVNIFLAIKYSSASLFLMAVGKLSHGSTLILFSCSLSVGCVCAQLLAFVSKVSYVSLKIMSLC